MKATRRGDHALKWVVAIGLLCAPGIGGALGTLLTGVTDQQLLDPQTGAGTPRSTEWTAVPPVPRPTPSTDPTSRDGGRR